MGQILVLEVVVLGLQAALNEVVGEVDNDCQSLSHHGCCQENVGGVPTVAKVVIEFKFDEFVKIEVSEPAENRPVEASGKSLAEAVQTFFAVNVSYLLESVLFLVLTVRNFRPDVDSIDDVEPTLADHVSERPGHSKPEHFVLVRCHFVAEEGVGGCECCCDDDAPPVEVHEIYSVVRLLFR